LENQAQSGVTWKRSVKQEWKGLVYIHTFKTPLSSPFYGQFSTRTRVSSFTLGFLPALVPEVKLLGINGTCILHRVTTFQTTSNSQTSPVRIATLLSMYVSMIISSIQHEQKTTTCASIGYFARLFVKKNLKNTRKYFLLVPLSRRAKTDDDFPPDCSPFSTTTLQFPDFSR